jgi:hypothetical protein
MLHQHTFSKKKKNEKHPTKHIDKQSLCHPDSFHIFIYNKFRTNHILKFAFSEHGEKYKNTDLLMGRSASHISLASKTYLFQHIPKYRKQKFSHQTWFNS